MNEKVAGSGCAIVLFAVFYMIIMFFINNGPEARKSQFENKKTLAEKDPSCQLRFDNIVRVMMHKPTEYTLYERNGDELKPHFLKSTNFTLIADVPPEKLMWAEGYKIKGSDPYTGWEDPIILKIHIHSEKEIQGGGWEVNRGKFGTETGNTIIVK